MRRIFLILLVIPVCCFGQDVDSLFTLYSQSKGEKRVKIANEMAEAAYNLECTDTLFVLSAKEDPLHTDAIVYELLSAYEIYTLDNYQRGIVSALKSAELYMQNSDTVSSDIMYYNAGCYYSRIGDYEHAIDLMHRCYEIEKQTNNTVALSHTLNSMGIIYSQWGKSEIAIKYFRESIDYERPLNRPMQYATRLSSLAKEYLSLERNKEALNLIKEALEYDKQITRKEKEERIAVHLTVLGDIYIAMDSLVQAENCFRAGIEVFEKNNRQQMLAISFLSLGRLYLKKNHFNEAAATLKRCSDICEKHGFLKIQRDACHFLYEAYKQTGSTAHALSALENYKTLNDSIFKETTQKQMNEFQVRYETAEKELEIERQQAIIEHTKVMRNTLITSLIATMIVLALAFYILRLRKKRNQALAEMNVTKDKFFSIISHDLQNPVIAQRNALQALINHADKMDAESLKQYYAELLKSTDSQVGLLYDLLNWAKLQSGRMAFNPQEFNLKTLVEETVNVLKTHIAGKQIRLNIDFPNEEQIIIYADRTMMAIVLRNLLTNATKFTPQGGEIRLHVETLCATSLQSVQISVEDSGIGMDEETQRNLFNIDRQNSRTGTAGEQGSGLGLIVCKELVEQNGGTMTVKSEVDKGSKITIEI